MFSICKRESLTNNIVREAFDISDEDKYKASRIIKDKLEALYSLSQHRAIQQGMNLNKGNKRSKNA